MNTSNPRPLPLAVAVCDGDQERVELLLDAGEPINKRDYKGRTALVLALLSSERDIACLLLERGADPNLHDARGRLPLNLSLEQEDAELAGLILVRGARPNATDRKGRTPLHLAAACGDAPLVTRLMKQQAPLEARDNHGATALHHAASNRSKAAARALLRGEPDLEIRNGNERTALWVAVQNGAHGVQELLLAAGADPRAPAWRDGASLDLAYAKQDYRAVELMEGPGARARIEADLAAATEHRIPEAYCEELEGRLASLRESIGPISNEPRFDVNSFLEVFDQVRPEPGYVLDYYHNHLDRHVLSVGPDSRPSNKKTIRRRNRLRSFIDLDEPDELSAASRIPPDSNAQPYVFTRAEDTPRDEAVEIARDLYWQRPHLMKHLEFERSPEGYLQWAAFHRAVNQFHLCWHAGYDDLRHILSRAGLDRTLEYLTPPDEPIRTGNIVRLPRGYRGRPLPAAGKEKLRALDLTPKVMVAGDLGEVRVLTFTKWGGFAFRTYHLRRPHHVDRIEVEPVVGYDCGIQF